MDLPDVQSSIDTRNVPLTGAGVSCVEMPMQFAQGDVYKQPVQAVVTCGVDVPPEQRGVHMSRFVELMTDWSSEYPLTCDPRSFLDACCSRLEADDAYAHWKIRFFLPKQAPASGKVAPMGYDLKIRGGKKAGEYTCEADLVIVASNCCPCSKDIADYGAHNQRLELHVTLQFDLSASIADFPLATLIDHLEQQTSCPAHPLLKRTDEKMVTEQQYDQAKFTEDVVRDCALVLQKTQGLLGFSIKAAALESIHKHNAWALYEEMQ